jgi:hypothetical protein
MTVQNLTAPRLRVLRAARDGKLWRSESGADLYRTYITGQSRPVSARVMDALTRLGLLATGAREGLIRTWCLTNEGAAILSQSEDS